MASKLIIVLSMLCGTNVSPWAPRIHNRSRMSSSSSSWSSLFVSQGGSDDSMGDKERMRAVRTIQDTFYNWNSRECPSLDPSTGIMRNLPLWTAAYVELPGRAGMLTVRDDGLHTHMFEQLVRSPKPWYFGHLFLPAGIDDLQNSPNSSYHEEEEQTRHKKAVPSAGVRVGCLMQVRDFRRLVDGGFVLFVQATERFVLDRVIQTLPYSMADVQILPDIPSPTVSKDEKERSASKRRAKQVESSFLYHDYEFANTELPLPKSQYIDANMEVGMALMEILSYSFYSKDESLLNTAAVRDSYGHDDSDGMNEEDSPSPSSSLELSLECRLLENRILREPSKVERSADESERLVWLGLEDYCKSVEVPLPEQVLCLKPREFHYLNLPDATDPVSRNYPKCRRQSRLSYAIAGILGNIHLWQDVLEIPSMEARLEIVLSQLYARQQLVEGRFQ